MAEESVYEAEGALDAAMTETIRAKLAEINERPEDDGAPPESPDAPSLASTPAVTPSDKPRDTTGKFTKAAESAPPASIPASPVTGEDSPPEGADPEQSIANAPQPIADLTRPPPQWKPAAKNAWGNLPEEVRAEVHRRESDSLIRNQETREVAQFGKTMRNTFEPYRMLIEAEGGTPEKAAADLLRTAALFRVGTPEQKRAALLQIDRQYNVGIAQHFAQPQPDQQPQQHAPFVDPRVDQLMASMQQQERARAAEGERIANSAVDAFIGATNAQGQLLYPFVDNIADDMSARAASLRQQNPSANAQDILKQAYDAAVWANPETRAVLLSQQQAQANQPADTLRKVEQARRASATNIPRRGALPRAQPEAALVLGTPESDDAIRETYRQLRANS